MELRKNQPERVEGWIYEAEDPNCKVGLFQVPENPGEIIKMGLSKINGYFMPKCTKISLANDCLAKAVKMALKCPFFTRREQVVRLSQIADNISEIKAQEEKKKGGIKP